MLYTNHKFIYTPVRAAGIGMGGQLSCIHPTKRQVNITQGRALVLYCCIVILILVTGCASESVKFERVTVAEKQLLLRGSSLAVNPPVPLPNVDVFGLSDEIKNFIIATVAGAGSEEKRINALVRAVLASDQLGLQFDDTATYTAREAFHRRRGNCLTFTILMVSMLRYLDVSVEFNNVEVPPIWDLRENLLILSQHVNAVLSGPAGRSKVLDINMEEFEFHYPQHRIDDRTVAALYYNNRGMELLLTGAVQESFRYMRKALDLAPELPYLWTNLGTLYRNQGLFREAEIAYRYAIELDHSNLVAISKAERNYLDLGKYELAEQFNQRAKTFRLNNPYYLYSLARDETLAGDFATALDKINAAIRHYPKEHRFYFLQGFIYSSLSERKKASTSFKKALELATSQERQEKYRTKMEKLIQVK